jgi:hypothetical protein
VLTCKQFRELHQVIDAIYDEADALGYSWQDMADRAGIHYMTVRALARYDTMYPRANTVFLLARAVGLKITLVVKKGKYARYQTA